MAVEHLHGDLQLGRQFERIRFFIPVASFLRHVGPYVLPQVAEHRIFVGGNVDAGVIFRNINFEDPRPTLQQFFVCMTIPKPYSNDADHRAAGDLSGILFQNISIAAPSVPGEPQILWGQGDARVRHFTFKNLTVSGKPVRDSAFFKTNEFVDGPIFVPEE